MDKQTSIEEVRAKYEKEIEKLGGKPVTKTSEIDQDDQIIALRKQLEELHKLKGEERDEASIEKKRKALKKELEDEIIALGGEPGTKKKEFVIKSYEDNFIKN